MDKALMMRHVLIVILILRIAACAAQVRDNTRQINISLGAGMTDWYNFAIKYQISQVQFGAAYGTSFFRDGNNGLTVLSVFVYKHLFGESEFSERRPWFIRSGVSYLSRHYDNEIQNEHLYGTIYFGRDINVSRRIGIGISGGPALRLYERTLGEEPDRALFLFPGFDVNVFYRFF